MRSMTVERHIRECSAELTPAERRVAEAVLQHPQSVAFGTVAELAKSARTSGATVVRLAVKLGYEGFIGLQGAIQQELAALLGPAAERIRHPVPDDVLSQILTGELDNLRSTLHSTDRTAFDQAVRWLTDANRRVVLCPGDCARGIALLMSDQLLSLRPDVTLIDGNQVRVGRELALIDDGDVVVAIDFHRYDRWVVLASELARERGAKLIAITDSRLGPLARSAHCTFVASAASVGPFDSQVAALALANALVVGAAEQLRPDASDRLGRVERLWKKMDALTDGG